MECRLYRAGIIGLGRIGVEFDDSHASAYIDCPDTELVASCDIKKVALYDDYIRMVKEQELDIVSVCTPPETHCQIVCNIAPYVRAIYCEKPIATTLEDADRMIETCHKHNVILQINHQRRFIRPRFRFSRGWLNTGTHMFDLLRQLFGEPTYIYPNGIGFASGLSCEIEKVDTDEPIFELDCTHNGERMILKGVEELVVCLQLGRQSKSSGEEARHALAAVLKMEKMGEKL